ncbi:MAG: glycosyltransferase, partial [bacterium]|nr:glycosyltransferase [bacterium]
MAKRHKRKKQKKKRSLHRGSVSEATISVCMIARDEADFLSRCLESVQGLADEIVVGDTGSSDATMEVARAAGARVLEVRWSGDFAAARNAVLEEVRCDWVLVVDCDEVLSPEDLGAIRKAAASGRAAGYRMTTRNYLRDSDRVGWRACKGEYAEEKDYPGWFPTTKVRLFQNNPRVHFEGALHELVERSIEAIGGAIGDCSVPVHHYGYVEKDSDSAKLEAYLDAARKKAAAEPGDAKAQYELALALRDTERPDEALAAIEQCLKNMEGAQAGQLQYMSQDHALLVKADISGRLKDRVGEEQAYRQALEVNPKSFEALNNLGTIRLRASALEEAKDFYERALQLAPEVEAIRLNLERVRKRLANDLGSGIGQAVDAGRLSVCLIVRDEEKVLDRCLASVRGVADEIVVVDTGSTDRSLDIVRSYGAQVFHFTWSDDFSAARNIGLSHATGRWILWLDADEYLRPEDQEKVTRAKALEPDQALLFTLVNEGTDQSRFRQVKMFPNRQEIRFERPVHETVLPSLRRLAMDVVGTDAEVRHTGYAEARTLEKKNARYFDLMEKWLEKHPEDHDIRFRTGHTLYVQGKWKEAEGRFREVVEAGLSAVETEALFRAAATFLG